MKGYAKGIYTCRRAFRMGYFDAKGGKCQTSDSQKDFLCCDLCSKDNYLTVPVSAPALMLERPEHEFQAQKKNTLKGKLITVKKSPLAELLHQSPEGKFSAASAPEMQMRIWTFWKRSSKI